MIKKSVGKHATVGMRNNGVIIEGFIQEADEEYFKIVEKDNDEVIVRIEDISFVKFSVPKMPEEQSETITSQEDFSMSLPAQENTQYKKPSFVRMTNK